MTLAKFADQLTAFELFLRHVLSVALLFTVLSHMFFPTSPNGTLTQLDPLYVSLHFFCCVIRCSKYRSAWTSGPQDTETKDIRVMQWALVASDDYH
jgi:hypothetical protein